MTEEEHRVKRLLGQLNLRVETFVDMAKEIWTEAQQAEAYGKIPSCQVLALIQEAEPAIFDHIEQLDSVLALLSGGKNSYVLRTKGDWRRRWSALLKRGVRLADVRYELLQCLVCGAVYPAGRDHFSQLTPRYWECPNGCNRQA